MQQPVKSSPSVQNVTCLTEQASGLAKVLVKHKLAKPAATATDMTRPDAPLLMPSPGELSGLLRLQNALNIIELYNYNSVKQPPSRIIQCGLDSMNTC